MLPGKCSRASTKCLSTLLPRTSLTWALMTMTRARRIGCLPGPTEYCGGQARRPAVLTLRTYVSFNVSTTELLVLLIRFVPMLISSLVPTNCPFLSGWPHCSFCHYISSCPMFACAAGCIQQPSRAFDKRSQARQRRVPCECVCAGSPRFSNLSGKHSRHGLTNLFLNVNLTDPRYATPTDSHHYREQAGRSVPEHITGE